MMDIPGIKKQELFYRAKIEKLTIRWRTSRLRRIGNKDCNFTGIS